MLTGDKARSAEGSDGVPTRLTAVVVDALDAQAQARFWAQALGWQLAQANPLGTQVAVRPADADSIGLLFISAPGR